MAPDITHLLEIYVTDDRVLTSEHNKPFAVVDEPLSFTTDVFDPASEGDSGPREATPQAYRAVKQPHLRIDMQYLAKNHSCGVVFGSGVGCDVSLARDDKTGIEGRHFAIQMKQELESFEIKVLSKRRTLIQLDSDGYVGVRRQRAFQGQSLDGKEKSVGIQIHSLSINLVAVNHSHHYGDFTKAWSKHYNEFSNQVAPLRGLTLSAGPSSTQRSLEYHPLDGYSGAGSGRCRLYRVLNKSTHFTYVAKEYQSIEDIKKEVVVLLRECHHHHIVKLYSFNEYATLPEISLEYIQESSLRENHINHILSVLEYKKFAKQALDALCYLHGRRTARRDLRLDTVIVQRRNPIHIKVAVDTTSDAEFLRTYDKNYLAPEVMERGICGCESDIWALGVMGMELFSGIEVGHHGLHDVQLQFSIGEKRWHICQDIENMTLPDPRLRWPARQLLRSGFAEQENDANDSLPALENGNLLHSSFSSPHETPKVGNSVTSPQDNSMPDTAPGTPSFGTETTPTAIAAITATDSTQPSSHRLQSRPEEQTVPIQPSHQSTGPTDRPSDRELRARRRAARKALG